MRRIFLVSIATAAVLIPAKAGGEPLPEPIAERISSGMSTRMRVAGWRMDLDVVDDRHAGRRRLCLTLLRRRTMGTSRIVTELSGCTHELTRYVVDAGQWHGRFAAEIQVRGDRFRQVYMDGAWHGTGVLAFPEDRVRVNLTFEGTGDTSPDADGGLCGFAYAPPFVGVCATASAERPAIVDGRISFGRIGRMVDRNAGRMQFWTRV